MSIIYEEIPAKQIRPQNGMNYRFQPSFSAQLQRLFPKTAPVKIANKIAFELCGIRDFFPCDDDYRAFLTLLETDECPGLQSGRREYGDFQTPQVLADQVCAYLQKQVEPKGLIEPTFGAGAFLISALKHFPELELVFGVEIHAHYCWHSKFRILEFFLKHPERPKPLIYLNQADVFMFDWQALDARLEGEVLVLGNPPWVTSAELGALNSGNLPLKSNFKKHKGLEALTGRSNFDIGESVVLHMLKAFGHREGCLAMLLKQSVIRNLVRDIRQTNIKFSELQSLGFDAQKYFDAGVAAALLTGRFNRRARGECATFRFSQPPVFEKKFGWVQDKFVSDVKRYQKHDEFDGACPFEWRQGVKHDHAKVFELKKTAAGFENGFGERVVVEQSRIHGLLKSSDLKGGIVTIPRKYVILTQRKLNEDTAHLKHSHPDLHAYLLAKSVFLAQRKSSIYRNRPAFSMFGVGDYAFKPFKVGVSGLYKQPAFTLILPQNGKPMMLDDTCYFLGFDQLSQAVFTWLLLKDARVCGLLQSIIFADAKRPYTKEVLQRVAFDKVAGTVTFGELAEKLESLAPQLPERIDYSDWEDFLVLIKNQEFARVSN